jgi:hypothetical protein
VTQETLTGMRRSVMSELEATRRSFGWALRLERFLVLALKKPQHAAVAFAVVAIVSATLLGQIRYSTAELHPYQAAFASGDVLLRPASYREWVFAGSSLGAGHDDGRTTDSLHNVYITPDAYREYHRSGTFPDGTVMVMEILSPALKEEVLGLKVSVKDSRRFPEGWGFFEFTQSGKAAIEAALLPQTANCLSCHRDRAATDHVFTQFYPALRTAAARL